MKVVKISIDGLRPAVPEPVYGSRGWYWAFSHGERGRGRWEVRLPLAVRDFQFSVPELTFLGPRPPEESGWAYRYECPACGGRDGKSADPEWLRRNEPAELLCWRCLRQQRELLASSVNVRVVRLDGQDQRGNSLLVLRRGEDHGFVVLWSLSPGFRGGATYRVDGQASLLAEGEEAQGAAGRMGSAPCPVVLVTGPAVLSWRRSGRLYGSPEAWEARFDGANWSVGPVDQLAAEDAAFA